LSGADLTRAAAANPYPEACAKPQYLHLWFLEKAPPRRPRGRSRRSGRRASASRCVTGCCTSRPRRGSDARGSQHERKACSVSRRRHATGARSHGCWRWRGPRTEAPGGDCESRGRRRPAPRRLTSR
jgi:hypothetical protein